MGASLLAKAADQSPSVLNVPASSLAARSHRFGFGSMGWYQHYE
ncbi:hypothetical protein OU5_2159 [Pseudomonas mandelii JR-1]|uniref:Uncharacterized protein n=1 Tax=Pseudomonas mandelii JR-1 TaxID=1147786 RepID=A0A024EA95_9PSED|nr:hypothetical protein OU5_2159 [Pseudomonas mandelii JR-1]